MEQVLIHHLHDVDPKTQSINIEQKLFQGFAGIASMYKKVKLD